VTILIIGVLIPCIEIELYPTVSISWSWLPLQVSGAREDVRWLGMVARERVPPRGENKTTQNKTTALTRQD
jgi:hypothetical protein